MIVISDAEALNLERSRQKGVAMLHSKNKWIANDATINQVIDKCDELNDVSGLLDGSATEIVDNEATGLRSYACANVQDLLKAVFKNAITAGGSIFQSCKKLKVIDMPKLQSISGFFGYTGGNTYPSLEVLYCKNLESWSTAQDLREPKSLNKIIMPKLDTLGQVFQYASNIPLKLFDCKLSAIPTSLVTSSLETMIIRSDTVPTLSSTSLFTNNGTIFYIKQSLVAEMKQATNWSALPNINDRIVALEGSDYEDPGWYEDTDEYKILFGDEEESEE